MGGPEPRVACPSPACAPDALGLGLASSSFKLRYLPQESEGYLNVYSNNEYLNMNSHTAEFS